MCNLKNKRSARAAIFMAAAAVASITGAASAQNTPVVIWNNATSGNYNTPANWTPNVTPSNAALQFLEINNGGTAVVDGSATYEGAFLNLGLHNGESGSLLISGTATMNLGELRVGGRETIPNNFADWTAGTTGNGGGQGFVVQSGGTVNVNFATGQPQSLYVGDGGLAAGNTANGSYTISGGNLNIGLATTDQILIGSGVASQGAFDQQNGAVASTGSIIVGRRGGTGTYTMAAGTLQAATNLFIGDGENNLSVTGTSGSFDQSNGAVTTTLATVIGRGGGTGTYTINGGSLTANAADVATTNSGSLDIGFGGIGTLTQGNTTTNPNVTVVAKQSMHVGGAFGSSAGTGNYILNSGTLTVGTTTSHVLYVGRGVGSIGTFTQKAGTTVTAGAIHVGDNSTSSNLYDMQGGTLNTIGDLDVGGFGVANQSSNGTFTQTAGNVNVGSNLVIGFASNSSNTGKYELKSGNLSLTRTGPAGTQTILAIGNGNGGAGTFVQTGGTLDVNNRTDRTDSIIDIGRGGVASGSYTLTAGTLDTQWLRLNANANNRADFNGGTSTIATNLQVSGGIAAITAGTHNIVGTTNTANSGLLHVSGGTVTFGGAVALSNTSTLRISGGTTVFSTANFSLGSGTTLRTSVPVAIPGQFRIGNSTVQVEASELKLTGGVFSDFPRTLTKTGAGTLTISGAQVHTSVTVPGSAYTVTEGILNMDSDGTALLTVNTNGGTTNFRASQNLTAVNVDSGSTATLQHSAAGDLFIRAGAVTVPNGKLDLKNNKMIVVGNASASAWNGSAYGGAVGLLASGYAGGAWNGNGIVSSDATPAAHTTLASASADDLGLVGGTFAGQTVASGDLLVRYTYAGDANLSGKIDADDYFLIDSNYNKYSNTDKTLNIGVAYRKGDFNYDGMINGDDYFIVDQAFVNQGPPLAAPLTVGGVSAVPEPSSLLAVAAMGAKGAMRRRRSR